jgi:tripartite-type tricarboxylate transporter receptor subunit TctC
VFSDLGPALPLIKGGKLRPLAVTTKQRVLALPNVPPLDQAVPGYDVAAWQGVVVPAQTPELIISKLNTKLNSIVGMDDVRARMADLGMIPAGKGNAEEMQQFLRSEIVRWRGIVEMAGIAGSE